MRNLSLLITLSTALACSSFPCKPDQDDFFPNVHVDPDPLCHLREEPLYDIELFQVQGFYPTPYVIVEEDELICPVQRWYVQCTIDEACKKRHEQRILESHQQAQQQAQQATQEMLEAQAKYPNQQPQQAQQVQQSR